MHEAFLLGTKFCQKFKFELVMILWTFAWCLWKGKVWRSRISKIFSGSHFIEILKEFSWKFPAILCDFHTFKSFEEHCTQQAYKTTYLQAFPPTLAFKMQSILSCYAFQSKTRFSRLKKLSFSPESSIFNRKPQVCETNNLIHM